MTIDLNKIRVYWENYGTDREGMSDGGEDQWKPGNPPY